MAASRNEIAGWFDQAKEAGATHMIVVCDTFDHDDYPVNVMSGEDVNEQIKKYNGKNMQQIMEVYSMKLDKETQLNEERAYHTE